ncbi:BTB and MATH domain-containing protein 36-like [Montipora capricornis]|uniref:BTB and MATH domain-containing protein 36-like n=1 Tax=Montipora capricornis TaxID=246305 RepID=UPI0035F110D2
MAATSYPPHFSEPWKFSDVVLVVEDQRFHVHRGTLAFWSPVFERMLTADFKEKGNYEISLPGKKASEFEEMLQMMYPSLEEKLITQRNCYFLFELAHEYQIDSVAQKSTNLMVSMVTNRREDDVLGMLIYAQKYEIKSLISTCIYEARRLTLEQLKEHGKRDQIEPDNYLQIAEGIIKRLEEQCKDVRVTCKEKLQQVSENLYRHVVFKRGGFISNTKNWLTTRYLNNVKGDGSQCSVRCDSLSAVAEELLVINAKIDSLP